MVLLVAGLSGCEEEGDIITTENESTQLNLVFNNKVGNEALAYNQSYADANGRRYTFTLSRYYISNIRLIDELQNEVNLDAYLLVKPEKQTIYTVDTVKPGKYVGMKFDIGLDSVTNTTNPPDYPEGDPLALQGDVSMHSGILGYYFVKLEGKVDTSSVLNGPTDFKWEFHLLGDPLLRTVEVAQTFEVKAGINVNVNLACDYGLWLNGIDLSIHNMTTNSLAKRVADNIHSAFNLDTAN